MTAINSNRAIRGPVTAVPVVAGKGVRLVADTENNRWVVEADETVLWEGKQVAGNTVSLSESAANFEKLAVFVSCEDVFITAPTKFETLQENSTTNGTIIRPCGEVSKSIIAQENGLYVWGGEIKLKDTTCQIGSFRRWHINGSGIVDHTSLTFLSRVVGIHRIANN